MAKPNYRIGTEKTVEDEGDSRAIVASLSLRKSKDYELGDRTFCFSDSPNCSCNPQCNCQNDCGCDGHCGNHCYCVSECKCNSDCGCDRDDPCRNDTCGPY